MNDLRITISLKNNILISKREELQLTQKKMAWFLQIPMAIYIDFENLKKHPNDSDIFFDYGQQMAITLDCNIETLFPENLTRIKLNKKIVEVDSSHLQTLSYEPKQILQIESKDLKNKINEVLKTLSLREEKIIRQRFFDNKTFKQIGENLEQLTRSGKPKGTYGVGKDITQQCEMSALRKLRRGSRRKKLKEFVE